MTDYFDLQEIRDPEERLTRNLAQLREQIMHAKSNTDYFRRTLHGVDPDHVTSMADLAKLPVLRKSDLIDLQAKAPPFGGLNASEPGNLVRVHISPGPIADPEGHGADWWRFGRAVWAAGFRHGEIALNSFSYHLTPAGPMFESAAHACGCAVIPGGTGNSEGQVRAAAYYKAAGYVGTPDFLQTLLDKAEELGLELAFTKALVSAGPLFPSMREAYKERGVRVLQCYGTADLGNVAYESTAQEGLIRDEDVIVEIVRPGTGDPVPEGEVGEVVVTLLSNKDYPLIRFATGDLSAILPGKSPCGRTAPRIKGWMGRADQTTKIKGMFVRPEQVAEIAARHPEIVKARVVVSSDDQKRDKMTLRVEAKDDLDRDRLAESVNAVTKLKAEIDVTDPGNLPNDGLVIEDARDFES